jgi:hypothetical protein
MSPSGREVFRLGSLQGIIHLRKGFSFTHSLRQETLPCAGYHSCDPDAPVAAPPPTGHAAVTPWGSA